MAGTPGTDDAEIVNRLRQGIIDGRLAVDGRVRTERDLADAFGISRTRVRRALDVLENEGIVFRRHGQGTFAAPPPAVEVGGLRHLAKSVTPQDVMEVRLEVEPALAAFAAQRASADEIAVLGRALSATLEATGPEAYETADEIFHYRIAQMARNPLFLNVYDVIRGVRRQGDWTGSRERTHLPGTIRALGNQHREVFNRIAARDAPGAGEAMHRHLVEVGQAMLRRRVWDGSGPGD